MNELCSSGAARRWTWSCRLVSRTMSILSVRLVAVMSCLVFAFVPSQQQNEKKEGASWRRRRKRKKNLFFITRDPWKKSHCATLLDELGDGLLSVCGEDEWVVVVGSFFHTPTTTRPYLSFSTILCLCVCVECGGGSVDVFCYCGNLNKIISLFSSYPLYF